VEKILPYNIIHCMSDMVVTKEKIDAVKMMREIREKLSEEYQDFETEKKDLEKIRKKYNLH